MRLKMLLCGVSSVTVAVVQASAPVQPIVRQIGGVTTFEHGADAFGRAPKRALEAKALAVAGGADGDPAYDLTRAIMYQLLQDGRVATLARVGPQFFLFGPDGRAERVLARAGQGPGELRTPGGMARVRGDTLIVPDAGNNRISWYTTRGFARSKPMPAVTTDGVLKPVGVLVNGAIVMTTSGLVQSSVPGRITRPAAQVVVVSANGDRGTVVANLPDIEVVTRETRFRGALGSGSAVLRYGRSALSVAWDSVIATGSGDGYVIDLRDATGRIVGRFRVAQPRRAVTKAMRDTVIALALARLNTPTSEQMVDAAESRRLARVDPFADSLPPYQSFHVSPNGTLWVVDGMTPIDSRWMATGFRHDGAILARLEGPPGTRPVSFGVDRVLLHATGADGLVELRVHRMVPAR